MPTIKRLRQYLAKLAKQGGKVEENWKALEELLGPVLVNLQREAMQSDLHRR